MSELFEKRNINYDLCSLLIAFCKCGCIWCEVSEILCRKSIEHCSV